VAGLWGCGPEINANTSPKKMKAFQGPQRGLTVAASEFSQQKGPGRSHWTKKGGTGRGTREPAKRVWWDYARGVPGGVIVRGKRKEKKNTGIIGKARLLRDNRRLGKKWCTVKTLGKREPAKEGEGTRSSQKKCTENRLRGGGGKKKKKER